MYWKELTTGIYPWDMHDEGIENILDNIQRLAGNNAAYMLALMHNEKRPKHANYYPHNPVRKLYMPEDSRCYWKLDHKFYNDCRIKPLECEQDFLRGKDWMGIFVEALRKRGMKTGAEISHTPLDDMRCSGEYADCAQRDIYGNFVSFGYASNSILCWNSPDARAYMCAMASDLAANYDLDMIQTCSLLFSPGRLNAHSFLGVVLGGCFCENCENEARKAGLDWERIKKTVRFLADILNKASVEADEKRILIRRGDSTPTMYLLEYPELFEWMRFRCNSITRYFKELSEAVHSVRPQIDLRFNTCWPESEFIGQDLTQIKKYINSVRIMDYSEQTGIEEKVMNKGTWISNVRRQVGYDMDIIGCIAPRAKATPDLIKKGIRVAALNGVDSLAYGFYDGASMECLRAIREGMAEAEVELIKT